MAVTEVAAVTVTAQVAVPEQAPLQPAKEEPAAGVAVRVMGVPRGDGLRAGGAAVDAGGAAGHGAGRRRRSW